MPENFDRSREILHQRNEQSRSFTIEVRGQKFDFLEIQSAEPSDTLLAHLPGFGEDVELYAEPMHILMGKSYCTLALKGYGETYSRESLAEALGQAIALSGKPNTILHGDSFGASVVYDLISDPAGREFLTRNNVRGAVLEAPFLDKEHLRSGARAIPDTILLRGSLMFDRIRGLKSLAPKQEGLVKLSPSEKKSILSEALREKTTEKSINVPVHIVLVQNESLSDNRKIMETIRRQTKNVSSSTVMSAGDNGHHIADNEYEPMWKKEKEAIDSFIKPL